CFFSSRRRHTRSKRDWSSDVCSSDLVLMVSKSLDSLRSGDLVLVWLQVKASNSVPDALVVDLLPAGLELENQNLANGSASLEQSGGEVQNLLNQMQQASIKHIEFRDDRFVA